MNNSILALMVAIVVGVVEINMIRKYGIYTIPYLAFAFIAVSLIFGAIEKS